MPEFRFFRFFQKKIPAMGLDSPPKKKKKKEKTIKKKEKKKTIEKKKNVPTPSEKMKLNSGHMIALYS